VTLRAAVLAAGLALLVPTAVRAHPHVFIDYTLVVRAGAGGVEAVDVTWTFDPLFSAMVQGAFDEDRDGTLSPREVRAIEDKHVANIKRFNYFLDVRVNGRPQTVTIRDFRARIPRDRLVYAFTVPVTADGAQGTIEIAVADPTIYTAFLPAERAPVEARPSPRYRVDCQLNHPRADNPPAATCTYRRTAP
jgi:ABC-type uncharacterized transport system substrate-binding protein